MPVPIKVIDGAHAYSTQLISCSNGSNYIADNFTVNRETTKAQDRTASGSPQRQRSTAGFDTWSATIQAPSGTSAWPKHGDYFTLTLDDNYGAENFAFDPVNNETANDPGAIRKIPATGFKLYNGVPPTYVAS